MGSFEEKIKKVFNDFRKAVNAKPFEKATINKDQNGLIILGYNPDDCRFLKTNYLIVEINGVFNWVQFTAIHDYYSISQFGNNVNSDIIKIRKLIWNFKEGLNTSDVVNLFYKNLCEFEGRSNTVIITIPASTMKKNSIRFSKFTDSLTKLLKIGNHFNAITPIDHLPVKGKSGDRLQYFNFNQNLITGYDILLIDDVITTGDSFSQIAKHLLQLGAKSVNGYFLAKTIYK